MITSHIQLIEALGGQTAVGHELGTHRRNVHWWVHRGTPAQKWREPLLALADKYHLELSEDFREAFRAEDKYSE